MDSGRGTVVMALQARPSAIASIRGERRWQSHVTGLELRHRELVPAAVGQLRSVKDSWRSDGGFPTLSAFAESHRIKRHAKPEGDFAVMHTGDSRISYGCHLRTRIQV